jgi:putative ABC transport system permease protein
MNYFLFALKNLRKKGIRSLLTLLGICIGITAVVSLISLGEGLKFAVNSQFGAASTEVISVQAGGTGFSVPGSDISKPLTEDDVKALDSLSSVDFAIARNIETASIEFNDKLIFGSAVSVPEGYEDELYEVTGIEAEHGRLLRTGDFKKVIIGNSLSDSSKNGFGKSIMPGKKILILEEEFTVAGVLKKEGSFTTDGVIFMYNNELEDLAGYGDNVDIIAVKVKYKELIDRAETDIKRVMREQRDVEIGGEDFSVSTPESSLSQVNQILDAIQIFIVIIASISIMIGAIGIINTMTTAVLERRKEIGIMKAIGAKNSQIFYQFFVESGFLGLIGGGAGVILGIMLGYAGTIGLNSFIGSDTRPQVSFFLIAFSLFGSFLIGAGAGIFPAMRAAKQNPVEALRG